MAADRPAAQVLREEAERAIYDARRFLLSHDNAFYGPVKDHRCGCPACKVIRPLVAALRGVQGGTDG